MGLGETMNVRVAYWEDPEDVVWVDLPHRRMVGHDVYWVDDSKYGFYNFLFNMDTMYSGNRGAAFEMTDTGEVELSSWLPPATATRYVGVMLTDEQAEFVGII